MLFAIQFALLFSPAKSQFRPSDIDPIVQRQLNHMLPAHKYGRI